MSCGLWAMADLSSFEAPHVRDVDCVAFRDRFWLSIAHSSPPSGSWQKLNSAHVFRIRPIGPRGCSAWSVHILRRRIWPPGRIAAFFESSLCIAQYLFFCVFLEGVSPGSLCGSSSVSVSCLYSSASIKYPHPCSAVYIFPPLRRLWSFLSWWQVNVRPLEVIASQLQCYLPRSGWIWLSVYWGEISFVLHVLLVSIWSVSCYPVFLAVCGKIVDLLPWHVSKRAIMVCLSISLHSTSVLSVFSIAVATHPDETIRCAMRSVSNFHRFLGFLG